MSATIASFVASAASRLSVPFQSRSLALALCYAIGLIATRLMGQGVAGHPLLVIAAPAAVGMLIRLGGRLEPADVLRLMAVHLALGLLFADPIEVAAWDALRGAAHVCGAILLFQAARRRGVVRSPVRLMGAVALVSALSPVLPVAVDAARLALDGALAWRPLASAAIVDVVSMAMILAMVVTQGRDTLPTTPESGFTEEKRPGLWEYASAAALTVALVWFSLDAGRPEAALASSVALLWFALRLGLCATTIAAFAFAVIQLHFGGEGRGASLFAAGDPATAEMARYLTLVLLAAPSIVVATVVYDQQRLKRMFAYRAMHDGLTALVNRSRFIELLDVSSRQARAGKTRFLLLLIDLDHFKSVNDSFGHARGDRLLVAVSSRLKLSMRATDIVARLGGDEFAVLAPVPSVEDAMRLARRVIENVNEDCDLDGVVLRPSVTVGGVLAPDSSTDPQHLMLLADEAMYKAKAAGRNCWRFAMTEGKETLPPLAWRGADAELAAETVFLD